MAGFQYIALEDGQINSSSEEGSALYRTMSIIVFSCRVYGFLISLLGTLLCIITQEYLKTMQHETIETQVRGILLYANFFQCCDYTAILATLLLAISQNLLIWNETVPVSFAIATNIVTTSVGLGFLYSFHVIIVGRQRSRMIYDDPIFIAAKKKL